MSRTYRQSSEITPELRELDPRNQLLSRGARFRLSAETVRDESLAVAGLLSEKMGGLPVMPPQPDGLWRSTYNGQKWVNAEGEDRFRRALYTYLKRTTPYPSMTTFDGGSGEVCQIRRIRTNTPLQALVTLNDPRPLIALQQDIQTAFGDDAKSPAEFIVSTRATRPDDMTDAEFASWIVVANTILNLDEFLTKN